MIIGLPQNPSSHKSAPGQRLHPILHDRFVILCLWTALEVDPKGPLSGIQSAIWSRDEVWVEYSWSESRVFWWVYPRLKDGEYMVYGWVGFGRVMGWNRWEIVTTTSKFKSLLYPTISFIMNLKNPATEPIPGTHCACSHTTPGISFEDMQVNIRVVIML